MKAHVFAKFQEKQQHTNLMFRNQDCSDLVGGKISDSKSSTQYAERLLKCVYSQGKLKVNKNNQEKHFHSKC